MYLLFVFEVRDFVKELISVLQSKIMKRVLPVRQWYDSVIIRHSHPGQASKGLKLHYSEPQRIHSCLPAYTSFTFVFITRI